MTLILSQLKRILGRADFDLESQIRSLMNKEIDKLTQDLLNVKAQNDLEEWFQNREKNNKKN